MDQIVVEDHSDGKRVIAPAYMAAELANYLEGQGFGGDLAYRYDERGKPAAGVITLASDADRAEVRRLIAAWDVPDKPQAVGSVELKLEHVVLTADATFEVLTKASSILLQAFFIPERNTSDGVLIQSVTPAWREIIKQILANPNAAHEIGGRKWEELIAAAYHADGFDEVTLTPSSNDFGRDVIAVKHGFGCIRIIDQVKAYSPGHLVDANDVRALLGVLSADLNATKGIVTTTSGFAPRIKDDPSIAPFMPFRLELIDGKTLLERLKELGGS